MAVAHDAVSESHTGTTGAASVASFTWNHVPTGTPRSALVFVHSVGALTDTSVTYGGVAMTAIPYTADCTSGENGAVRAYFLDNCGSGTKAVVVNRTNNTVVTYATCMTQTAASAAEVYLAGVKTKAGSATEATAASSTSASVSSAWSTMALTDGSPGTNSIRYLAVHSGASSVPAASTNTTDNGTSASIDYGNYVFFTMRETTPSQGSKTLTIGTAISDDLAAIGLAVREKPVDNRNYSAVLTGGGVLTSVMAKGANSDGDATGGGVFTLAYDRSAKAATYSAVLTGGGVVVPSASKAGAGTGTATGGGVATTTRLKGGKANGTATGGGVTVAASRKGGAVAGAATGGGVVTTTRTKAGASAAVGTGGGVVTTTRTKAGASSTAATGGGVFVGSVWKGGASSTSGTGGGIFTLDYSAAVNPSSGREVSAHITGGGILTLDYSRSVEAVTQRVLHQQMTEDHSEPAPGSGAARRRRQQMRDRSAQAMQDAMAADAAQENLLLLM